MLKQTNKPGESRAGFCCVHPVRVVQLVMAKTTPFNSWGVKKSNGIEMYIWIYSDADIDEFIDARKYAVEFDLKLKCIRKHHFKEVCCACGDPKKIGTHGRYTCKV